MDKRKLIDLYKKKSDWIGCAGVMSIIEWDFMNKIDIETAWKHFEPTEPFDEEKAKMMRAEGVQQINFEIQQIKDNLKNNTYGEHTTSSMDDMSYFMEVLETIDSIAIARITGSQTPVYRVRIGDNVLIAK